MIREINSVGERPESLFVMAQVAPTEYPKDNLEKADSLVKEAAEKYHPGMIIFPETL